MRTSWKNGFAALLLTGLIAGCGAGSGTPMGSGGESGAKPTQTAPATTYPQRQVTYLIAFDPGGQSDREARRQQPHLERLLGQKVIIDYKAGGGGALGWTELIRAKPDGYIIGGINVPHIVLQPLLQQQTGYKTEELKPVVLFQRTPIGLAVLKDSPYQTLEELIAAAKARPNEITISGSGTNTGAHFASTLLNQLTGATFKYVPFNGANPAMTNFLGGHTVATWGNSDDLVKNKDKIRVLAMADDQRFSQFPDTPTFKERNLTLVEAIDRGIAVPPGTPDEVVKILEAAFLEIARDPQVVEAMKSEGSVPLAMGAEETKAHIERMTAHYRDLIATMPK